MPGPPDASARTVDDEALVSAKLRAPDVRPSLVARPGLLARVDPTPTARLTLVVAPAGWGKTTLLLEWRALAGTPTAWLALERADNDPVRFWTYVVHALRGVAPGVGAGALAALKTGRGRVPDRVLPGLLEELAALPAQVALVLDDLHEITSPEVHDGLRFVVEHQPPTLHLLVTTRADPPLPLGRLRARGNVVEVRADQLRFSAEEARELLTGILDLDLTPEDVARLHARTEGWAAGLYLAALSIQGQPDPAAFVAAFAGDDRHVVDYLGAEVLDAQDPDVREFLLLTSVLERLSGPLCNAVTAGTTRTPCWSGSSARTCSSSPSTRGGAGSATTTSSASSCATSSSGPGPPWSGSCTPARRTGTRPPARPPRRSRTPSPRAGPTRAWPSSSGTGTPTSIWDGWPRSATGLMDSPPTRCAPVPRSACPGLGPASTWAAGRRRRVDLVRGGGAGAPPADPPPGPGRGRRRRAADGPLLQGRGPGPRRGGRTKRDRARPRRRRLPAHGGLCDPRRGRAVVLSGAPARGTPALEEALRLAEDASNLLATSYSVGFLALAAADAGDPERAGRSPGARWPWPPSTASTSTSSP